MPKQFTKLFLGIFVCCWQFSLISQGCAVTSEVTIVAQGSSNVILNVEGLVNDDLSSNQSLCGVRIVFKHDLVENIRMVLVSPSGQRITLVGPGRINSNPSPFVTWNVAYVPCSVPPSPDPGISGTWDNGEPWASFSNYTGVYHPFDNCLEDLNIGSANGAWSLEIENLGDMEGVVQYFELIFCDPTGSACSECFLFAGNFNFSTPGGIYTFCEGDPMADFMDFKLDQDSILTASQEYSFIYSRNDSIVKRSSSPNEISDLMPGTYTLCGLAFQSNIQDSIENQVLKPQLDTLIDNRSLCADITEDCITLRILEIENKVTIDTIICEGDSVSFFGEVFYDELDTTVLISNLIQDRCDSLIYLSIRKKTVNAIIDNSSDFSQCGSSIFLNANSSNSNLGQIDDFEWSTVNGNFEIDLGPIAEINSGGTYYLTSYSEQCFDIDSITIMQVDTFDWEINTRIPNCFQDSFIINVSSTLNNVDFVLNAPQIVESIDNQYYYTFNEGTYNVVANFGTCQDSLQINLMHQATELSVSVSSTLITCFIDSSEIVINTNAINPEFTLSGTQSSVTTSDTIYTHNHGQYILVITDEFGCQIEQEFEVEEERENPVFDLQDISHLCNEGTPNLSAVISSPFDSVLWVGPNGFRSEFLDDTPVSIGIYSLTVFGENGCNLTQSLNYFIDNVPFDLDLTFEDINCENQGSEVCYLNPNNLEVLWFFNDDIIGSDDCFTATEEGRYYVEVTDSNGCFSSDSVFIDDVRVALDVQLDYNPESLTLTCGQSDVDIQAIINGSDNNAIIQWFDGAEEIGNENIITIQEPIELNLLVTDTTSKCIYTESFEIVQLPNPFENFEIDLVQPKCEGDFGQIIPISPVELSQYDIFLNNNLLIETIELQMLTPGSYTFEVIDENFCIADTTFIIENGRDLSLNLGDDIQTVFGTEVFIDAEVNIDENEIILYEWSNSDSLSCSDCLSPSFSVFKNENVILNITDEFGCEARDTLQVIIDNNVKYFVPNVFSPNDDGDNDNLTIYLSDAILKVFDLRVMDRWGNLVLFHPEILNENDILVWDGSFDGKPVVQGVYVYVAKLLLIDGTETLITGNITVIR